MRDVSGDGTSGGRYAEVWGMGVICREVERGGEAGGIPDAERGQL